MAVKNKPTDGSPFFRVSFSDRISKAVKDVSRVLLSLAQVKKLKLFLSSRKHGLITALRTDSYRSMS
jgi:hypothetical protein